MSFSNFSFQSIDSIHLKTEDYPLKHTFYLPYIFLPEGSWELKTNIRDWKIEVKHHPIPALMEIVTGFRFNPQNPMKISGSKELFKGISEIHVIEKNMIDNQPALLKDPIALRKEITSLLNNLQSRYMIFTGKYWYISVLANHFVNLQSYSASGNMIGMSSAWNGTGESIPDFVNDLSDKSKEKFQVLLSDNKRIETFRYFLIDARKHYFTGEFHIMYIDICIAFESLIGKALQKISNIYEKNMFKEGKLKGKVCHLLFSYCKWEESDLKGIINIIDFRNMVIHQTKRNFNAKKAYEHLIISENAVEDIYSFLSPNK